MSEEKVETKRSLIEGIDGKPYPNVAVDTPTSESWRTLEYNTYRAQRRNPKYNCTGLGIHGWPLREDLGLYPNITHTGGGFPEWGKMPYTDVDAANFGDRRMFHPWTEYNIIKIDRYQHVHNIEEESCEIPAFIEHFIEPLKTLAAFAQKNTSVMTVEEKKALIHCISVTGPYGWKMPEMLTRFVNPLGSMGTVESYKGINAYFYDLGNRFQHHSKNLRVNTNGRVNNPMASDIYAGPYVCDRRDAERNINDFFKIHEKMNLPEAARLLGQGALHFGIRPNTTDKERGDIIRNVRRHQMYLFVSKAVQRIKERVNGEDEHELLVIPKDDAEIIRNYGQGEYVKKYGVSSTIKAERDLMDEINAMMTPGAVEYKEMQRLLGGGDGMPGNYKFRVYQCDMMHEYKHAMNFLLSNNEEGKKLVFGR